MVKEAKMGYINLERLDNFMIGFVMANMLNPLKFQFRRASQWPRYTYLALATLDRLDYFKIGLLK